MESSWQRLSLSKQDGLPLLLYKLHTTSKSYEIYITDLTQLWREQLSYKQVLKRAEEDDTTIDPSEDPGQFAVLLEKIDEALRNSPGSSMVLTPGRGPNSESDSLHLQLYIKLPGPLKPLKWNVYLSKRPYTESTDHLLLALLREERDSEMRQRTLLEHLRQKDWVLAKLFDKIEAVGIDLSTIFPGTSGLRGTRKETSLAQASKYIKGVAPFNEQEWLDGTQAPIGASLARAVSGPASDDSRVNNLQPPPDKWWKSLEARSSVEISPEPEDRTEEPVPQEPESTSQMDIDTASEDDEFERQETPPRLKKHVPAAEPKPSPSPAKKSQSPPRTSKSLGRIGRGTGNKTKPQHSSPTPSRTPSPTPNSSPPKRPESPEPEPELEPEVGSATASTASSPDLDRISMKQPSPVRTTQDQETNSGSGSDEEPQPSPSKQANRVQNNKKPRGVIGVIGGKKKEPKPSSPPAPAKSQSPEQPKQKTTGKLGVIGGKSKPRATKSGPDTHTHTSTTEGSKNELSSPDMEIRPKSKQAGKGTEDGDGAPSASKVKKEVEPEPEQETEEQKANRKREELERQLEAKSKAPVKKRRKF